MLAWVRRVLTAPDYEDRDQARVARMVHGILWGYVGILLAFVVGAYIVSPAPPRVAGVPLGLGGLIVMAPLALLIRLNRHGQPRLVAVFVTGSMWIASTVWVWFSGGITDNRVTFIYSLIIVFAGLMLGRWSLVVFAALSLLGIYGGYASEQTGRVVPELVPVGIPQMGMTLAANLILAVLVFQGRRGLNAVLDEAQQSAMAQERANRQLQAMQSELDARVQRRTEELEIRASLLQTAVEVGGVAAAMRTPEELLRSVAESVSERFGLYHVGVYVTDPTHQRAALEAVGGDPGGEIPVVGYELSLEEGAVISECVRARAPYIAFGANVPRRVFDVGDVRVSESVARLPRTSVEVALPLALGGRTLGALDLHLEHAGSFRLIDLEAWQVVADQLAIALENARRYAQSEEALEAERSYQAQVSREGWAELLRSKAVAGYRYRNRRVEEAGDSWPAELEAALQREARVLVDGSADGDAGAAVAVPVRARGSTIGALHLKKRPAAGAWTSRELELLDTLTLQLETALESARLYRDTQTAAAHQRAVAEVGASIREEVEIEAVLSRALTELGKALAAEQGAVLLTLGEGPEGDSKPLDGSLSGDVR